MNKLICQKCGVEISNEFGVTLTYCTNCGESIKNLHTEKTVELNEVQTLVSPPTLNQNAPPKSNLTRNVLGCLGLGFGAVLLSAVGIFGYWYWSEKNSVNPDYFGKIVPPKSQTVRFVANEPESLDPHLRPEPIISNALFDGLAEYNNQNSDLTPSLATSWERNADATVWTFYLRKDAKWSDGKPITANDFVYSWKRLLNPDEKFNGYWLFNIKNAELYNTKKAKVEDVGVQAIDDYTLQVTMEKPTPFFDKLIALTAFRPVPRDAIEKFGKDWTKPENIVTSGAFKLTERTPKNQTVVERNPLFWDNANTKLEKIVFISDEKTPFGSEFRINPRELYEKGEIDATFTKSLPNESLKAKKDYLLEKGNGTEFININTTIKPFDDVRVRRALSLAIDREKLKENNLSNFPTTSFAPEFKGYENPKGASYNPVEARKLLADAGFPNGSNFPEIEYIYNTNETNRNIAEFFQEQWQKELGVKVKLVNLEFKEFFPKRNKFDYKGVARGGWFGDYADPYEFLNLLSEKNESGWNDKKYIEMLEKSNLETDQTKRYKLLIEAETYLLEQQPVIPLYNQAIAILCKPYVKNLVPNSLRQINWREVYVDPNITAGKL
ncbi:peptide ABC transporter substrate-binding protein [soil metagenome]